MNPIRAALRYPQVSLFLSAMLFAAGLYALFTMPRREDPKITIRTGVVAAFYPGATSREVEDQATRKIEEHLFHFAEVRRDKTYSTTLNGSVIVNVELNKSVKNADEFWSRLRLDMAQLKQTDLPQGVLGPVVDSDFGDTVAVLIAIHGGSYDYRDLKDYAQTVESGIRTIPAVSKIHRIGDQGEQIEVNSSSATLAQYAVSPLQIIGALRGRAAIEYGGRVPDGRNKVPINSSDPFHTEDEIRNTMVDVSRRTGQPVYIGDLATVERSYKDPSEYARIGGEKTILLSVEMNEGNNIEDLGKALDAKLAEIKTTLPPDVKLDLVANQPKMVTERIRDFMKEFGLAILAVIAVTILLLPLRVALVAAISIPASIAMTFGALEVCHVELQQVSIASLIVVLGMVVDNAILIVDNYVELLDHKVPIDEAAERAASEMAVPVLTATLAIIAAFAPMLFLTGAMGEFISALPISVTLSLSISYLVAMCLTPYTAKLFIQTGLKNHNEEEAEAKKGPSLLDRMQHVYNRVIVKAMRHRKEVLVGTVLTFVIGLLALAMIPQHLFPTAEREQFVMDIWMPEGTRIENTDATVRRIESVLAQEKLVKNYTSFVGSSAPRFYYNVNPQIPAANYAQILVNTTDVGKTPKLIYSLRDRLRELAPEATVIVKELQQGQVMEAPVEVRVVGDDAATLQALGGKVEEILRHTAGATYIMTDWHEPVLEAGVHVREEVANRLGLTNQAIADQLASGFDGLPAAAAWEGDRKMDVVLRLSPEKRQDFHDVSDMYVMSPVTGARVPVSAVATMTPEWQPGRIVRRNGVRMLTVRAFPANGQLASEILKQIHKQVDALEVPAGYRIVYGGEQENQVETFGEMKYVLIASILLIFLILLFQFRSLLDPVIIMTAFPLAVPGAALGLIVTHNTFGFTAFIGIVSVGGLVVRNAIILVDYIHQRIREGATLEEAALVAGERRLRPIFLTSSAAAVGVVPMILSGSSLWSPMGSVIAFGLMGSMLFTLVAIPVLFVVVYEKHRQMAAGAAAAVVVLALLAGIPAQAQETRQVQQTQQAQKRTITLEEAVRLAGEQNSLVKMAREKAQEAKGRTTQARANYFPVVTNQNLATHLNKTEVLQIPAGVLGNFSATGPVPASNINIELGKQNAFLTTTTAGQPLTQLLKIHAGYRAARAEAASADSDAIRARNEVALNVKMLYYHLLSAERKKHEVELRIEAGEEKLEEARRGVASGVILEDKVMDGEAQLATAKHGLGQIEDALSDMEIQMNDLLGLPLETELQLVDPEPDKEQEKDAAQAAGPEAVTVEELRAEALAHNPALASAQQTREKARAGVLAARAEFIPEITAFGQYIHQDGAPLLPKDTELAGFKSEWTISEFGKRIGLVKERSALRSQAEENVRHTENQVRIDIEKGLRKLRRTEDELDAARRTVKARTEALRIVGEQVHTNTVTHAALCEAQAQLAEAEAQLFDAEMDRAIARAELDRTLGRQP
ncbi:MAG: efflux RND transporter permease subunit [Terracidiphilus sp.]|nr:efflux RND transporter permease subunit [Terracidiphilus sp.]